MAYDSFLKIYGVDGESTNPGHEKWIDVFSWSWGVSRGVNVTGRAPLVVQSFSFAALVGPHSAKLLGMMAGNGTTAKTASLESTKIDVAGASPVAVKIDFFDVFLSVYDIGEGANGGPEEQVSFDFGKIEMFTGTNEATIIPPTIA